MIAARWWRRAVHLCTRSLTGRLLLGSVAATVLALVFVLVLMQQVLTRFVTGQIDQRLDNKIVALASQVKVMADGRLALDGQADGPPFDKRLHRSFWLVQGPSNVLATGWLAADGLVAAAAAVLPNAFTNPIPPPPPLDEAALHPRSLHGAILRGTVLYERAARVSLGGTVVTILAAAPAETVRAPVHEAMLRVGSAVLLLGAGLAAIALAQVRLGLRPLAALRSQLRAIVEGRRQRLPLDQPREIKPLVDEVNRLLESNAENLATARRHVANLAHGLKTPLATLQLAIGRLEGPGKGEVALLLTELDLRVRHHLGRARAGVLAGHGRARTPLAPRLADLGHALRHIHADRNICLTLEGPGDAAVACEAHDVDEIFGNLLDNAFRFARQRVACGVEDQGRTIAVTIADDGRGLASEEIALVLQPGRRLDEGSPGFGFGLTIARELVELYAGELRLLPGTTGLSVVVLLPAAGRTGVP